MKIYFKIENDVVVNTVVQPDDFMPPQGETWLESQGVGGIGWVYDPETQTISDPTVLPA